MKRVIGALLITTFLNGCSLPLLGSLTSSTITGLTTGNYQQSLVTSAIDFGVHGATGKTPGEHLYASLSNKYTDKKLEKHFPNKEIKWPSWHTYVKSANYTFLDKYAPNFQVHPDKKPIQTFSKSS
jgi:hypothetical protein|tara:strand:- start:867 stop:1244 length:378 start_codon:yes stop_codon:yes gene_type:complete